MYAIESGDSSVAFGRSGPDDRSSTTSTPRSGPVRPSNSEALRRSVTNRRASTLSAMSARRVGASAGSSGT